MYIYINIYIYIYTPCDLMGYRGIYDQDFYLGVVCYLILKDLPADWLQKGGEPEAVDDPSAPRRFSRAKSSARRVTEDAPGSHEQNISSGNLT